MTGPVRTTTEVAEALRDGRPVVALESSVLAHGLPSPANEEAARRMMVAVRRAGAVPAITAVVRGVPTAGLSEEELERFLARDGVVKISARDVAPAMVRGADGATTVAAAIVLAHAAGIPIFATGGIGGVHRGDGSGGVPDESADLGELAITPALVVCAGAKSILDLPGTMERLETLGVPVVGYRTSELPGFHTVHTGIPLSWRADSVAEVAALWRAQRSVVPSRSLVVAQPLPEEEALPSDVMDRAVHEALRLAQRAGVSGPAVTPYVLSEVERATGGASLRANLALLERNAALAAELSAALVAARR